MRHMASPTKGAQENKFIALHCSAAHRIAAQSRAEQSSSSISLVSRSTLAGCLAYLSATCPKSNLATTVHMPSGKKRLNPKSKLKPKARTQPTIANRTGVFSRLNDKSLVQSTPPAKPNPPSLDPDLALLVSFLGWDGTRHLGTLALN
jgi:hypothetical protein